MSNWFINYRKQRKQGIKYFVVNDKNDNKVGQTKPPTGPADAKVAADHRQSELKVSHLD